VGTREFIVAKGDGVHVWDENGRRYIDGSAGLWYCHVGHGRREIADAVSRQMGELECFSAFGDLSNRPAREVCDRLTSLSTMAEAKVFLTLGGGDGVETAAKVARQHWALEGRPEKHHLIGRTFGYHGTHGFGTTLVGMEPIRDGFGPLAGGVSHVAHDSVDALEREIERLGSERVAAFFCEPVIGAGGVRPAPPGYLEGIGEVCRRHEVLLVIDSVICAFGRVGTWLGYERWGLEPDIVVLAKGLTSGYLPLGAVLVSGEIAEPYWAGTADAMLRHGATYAGHPTCCAAALANLEILEREELIGRGAELEDVLFAAVSPLAEHPATGEIRGGVGLAAAIDLSPELQHEPGAVKAFYEAIRERGVLVRAQHTGVALGPPLIITPAEIAEIAHAIAGALDEVMDRFGSVAHASPA
jgi:adenosylmethionine-8-amino-7-oxononanoate aminotransferase